MANNQKYVEFLKPLEEATHRLEGKGKSGRFGALYEVIPTFDSILALYEAEKDRLSEVDYEIEDALEDHYKTSINLGWEKLSKYWDKLDESPAYYALFCTPNTSSTVKMRGLTSLLGY